MVINGTYTWLEEEPAVARFHSRDAYGVKGAATISEMQPVLTPGRVELRRKAKEQA